MWKEAWREHVRSMCKAYSERDERLHNVVVAAQRGLRESRTNGETFRPRPSLSVPLPPLASGLLFHPLAAAIEWPGITHLWRFKSASYYCWPRLCKRNSEGGLFSLFKDSPPMESPAWIKGGV